MSFDCRPVLAALMIFTAFLPCRAETAEAVDPLAEQFAAPPAEAKLRAYWWWLNGNVTKESITRDLEAMAAQGYGGALICDAGGASQDGNAPVPHGPDFFSAEWRELYKHALREGNRLGLEMSLNIQSGWNLGGPMVAAEDAPKKLVWSEIQLSGPAKLERALPEPKHPPAFYRDVAVVAFPVKSETVTDKPVVRVSASSTQSGFPVENIGDGRSDTFWVSQGDRPGEGPTRDDPEWIAFRFEKPVTISGARILGRKGYSPKEGELQVSDDGETWRAVETFSARDGQPLTIKFDGVKGRFFRFVFSSAYDSRFPDSPRNVQVVEASLLDDEGRNLTSSRTARRPIENWDKKALIRALSFSAPDTSLLLEQLPSVPGEEETHSTQVVELTDRMAADGTLRWDVPPGEWIVLRFGCTLNDHCRVSTHSDGWAGYALDPFDAEAFRTYWDAVVEPLIADAGPLAGTTLKWLHTDSWEVEVANWTPTLREEFRRRRGYDLLPFLPVIAGHIVDSRPVSNRFLNDFRKTMGDLAIDNHYRLFKQWAHRHDLLIHPESGGPHAVPVDSLRCLGMNDAPMSEFWAWSWRHRVGDTNRFFVKQPASAAHTYGHKYVNAEGFTTIGPHWQETLWDNLKPAFDKAACEGLNRLFWHTFTCSPKEMGLPGQEYFAGTHFNPNSTWWSRSGPFLAYIDRCQYMLQQGLFVADACYYYGDHVPNFAQLKSSDPAGVLPGYDYDVATEEVILARTNVRDGRIVLPDGMSYRVLVLPDRPNLSLPVLLKVKKMVEAGATVIGPKPQFVTGLRNYPECDEELKTLADELWGDSDGTTVTENRVGKGRVVSGRSAREVLQADGVPPDFAFSCGDEDIALDYIHRRDGDTDIYFIANREKRYANADCAFRVAGKQPEIWDPVTGEIRPAATWSQADGYTTLPLEFAPCGSMFVVFRKPADPPAADGAALNFAKWIPRAEITGPWTVEFDPKWGGPESAEFPELVSWTEREEEGIRYYSGTATYRKTFDLPDSLRDSNARLALDLGDVKQLAEVRLNGQDLGILWSVPFRVEATAALKPTGNVLEIDVVNFWPNRIIGDRRLPESERLTHTNIRKLTADTPLMESGLLGPVRIVSAIDRLEPRAVIPALQSGRTVSTQTMQAIHDEIKTPYKYGVIVRGEDGKSVDCPNVFRHGDAWYMLYVCMNKVGYETHLARSDDLVHWETLGKVLTFPESGWDKWQADGGLALQDTTLGGSCRLQTFDGRYWMSYIGGALQGYETDPLSIGMAWTTMPDQPVEWNRLAGNPVLSPAQPDARPFERVTLYKSNIIRDPARSLGFPFVMFYNGKNENRFEQIGMAVSDDMTRWHRYGEMPVVANNVEKQRGISGDPQIVKIGDVWVMFYFGAFWKPGAFDTFACSYDLVNWTKWNGPHLIEPSEPWDKTFAHKPWVIEHDGVVYHYYCAVGGEGRVIALATSAPIEK